MWALLTARWTPTPGWWTAEEYGLLISFWPLSCTSSCSAFPSSPFHLFGPWLMSSTTWSVTVRADVLFSHMRHSCYLFHVCSFRTEWLLINAWQHCLPGLGVVVYLFVLSPAGDVPVSTHSEGNSLWDSWPRQSTSAHTLGTDGLRRPVHVLTEVPHNLSNSSVSVLQVFKWSLVSFTQQILMQMIYYAALLHWLSGQNCIIWSVFRFFFKKNKNL